jgi:hypothetical protein
MLMNSGSAICKAQQGHTLGQAALLEHAITIDNRRRHFDCITDHVRTTFSPFIWNANKTRVGVQRKE